MFCSTVQDDFEGFMSIVNSRSMFPSLFEKVSYYFFNGHIGHNDDDDDEEEQHDEDQTQDHCFRLSIKV